MSILGRANSADYHCVMSNHPSLPTAAEPRHVQAFRLLEACGGTDEEVRRVHVLRDRLLGELIGDADRVAATLTADFELRMGGSEAAVPGATMVEGIRRQGAAGLAIWVELDDLLVRDDRIAANGTLHTLTRHAPDAEHAAELASCPIALFLRFAGDLMSSEVIYLDTANASSTSLEAADVLTPAEMSALVGA